MFNVFTLLECVYVRVITLRFLCILPILYVSIYKAINKKK